MDYEIAYFRRRTLFALSNLQPSFTLIPSILSICYDLSQYHARREYQGRMFRDAAPEGKTEQFVESLLKINKVLIFLLFYDDKLTAYLIIYALCQKQENSNMPSFYVKSNRILNSLAFYDRQPSANLRNRNAKIKKGGQFDEKSHEIIFTDLLSPGHAYTFNLPLFPRIVKPDPSNQELLSPFWSWDTKIARPPQFV